MLAGALVAALVFLFVVLASPHGFAIAWAEAWLCALVATIVFGAVVWHRHERRS